MENKAAVSSSRVGVILPVWNRATIIVEALESVAAQTLRPDRVVVVDDGSEDDTPQRVEAWAALNASRLDVRLVRQAHAGVSAARNRAAAELNGFDYYAFLDSDDLWPADYLHRVVHALDQAPDAVAASIDRLILDLSGGAKKLLRHRKIVDNTTQMILHGNVPTPSVTLVRAAQFHAAGGYDELLPRRNDLDFHLRLSLRGRWLYVPGEPAVMRRGFGPTFEGAQNLTDGQDSLQGRLYRLYVVENFIHRKGGSRSLPRTFWTKLLASRWRHLGRDLVKAGKRSQGAWCLRRALRYRPWWVKSWLSLLICGPVTPATPVLDSADRALHYPDPLILQEPAGDPSAACKRCGETDTGLYRHEKRGPMDPQQVRLP